MDRKGGNLSGGERQMLAIGEALLCYEDSALLGIQKKDGTTQLNPPMDTRFEPGDKGTMDQPPLSPREPILDRLGLSLIAIIGTFKAFNTIWIFRDSLALGTTDTFSVTIFIEFFEKLRYGYASAMAFVLFAIILSLTFINNKVQGSRVFYG